MHLVGDVHQPLHARGRISDEDPKGGDQGGNIFTITEDTPRNQSVNLHSFWDSIVIRSIARKDDSSDMEYLAPLGQRIMNKYPFAGMRNRLRLGDYSEWQQESFRIASQRLYPRSLKRFAMPSKAYQEESLRISEEQIAFAGYRLGALLNKIFGGETESAAVSCKIIRRVNYPVTKKQPVKQPLRIALLDLCPADKGMLARPMYSMKVDGKMKMFEYDVEKF